MQDLENPFQSGLVLHDHILTVAGSTTFRLSLRHRLIVVGLRSLRGADHQLGLLNADLRLTA